MRESFHRQLEILDQDVVRLGALVERSTELATNALIEGNKELARRVREGDDDIDRLFLDIEKRALAMLAQQAPVARDLRLIVAILRVVTDLERAGDLAFNIAELVEVEDFRASTIKPVRSLVADLGRTATRLLGMAIDAWTAKDETLASALAQEDDRLDDLHAELLGRLVELKGEDALGPAIRLAMIGRYFERIGDHAVNLGERVRYFVTGDEEHLG